MPIKATLVTQETGHLTLGTTDLSIGANGCLQTNTALSQLCNILWVSAETSGRKAQCIFALLYTAKILFPNIEKKLKIKPCVFF